MYFLCQRRWSIFVSTLGGDVVVCSILGISTFLSIGELYLLGKVLTQGTALDRAAQLVSHKVSSNDPYITTSLYSTSTSDI